MKKSFLLAIVITACIFSFAAPPKKEYYSIQIYHFSTVEQEQALDAYLEKAWLPAAHKLGFKNIGVFKPIANDTAATKRIYIITAATATDKLINMTALINADAAYKTAAASYLTTPYTQPAFTRIETILLSAFRLAPQMQLPQLKTPKEQHVYELRSYESPTEERYISKVKMFNEGGEITLFKRLQFNAVFYADVISGSRMPNLIYLTSFDTMEERNAHWKTFSADAEWKTLSAMAEYQRNVSKADIILMRAAAYSDY